MHLPATEKALDEVLSKMVGNLGWILVLIVWIVFAVLGARSDDKDMRNRMGAIMTSIDPKVQTPPKILKASDHVNDGKYHLLLAATGSVATIKIPNILEALSKYQNLSIRLLLSESAANFLQNQSGEQPSLKQLTKINNVDGIYRDADEWRKPWVRGDSILHIELRRWADLMAIIPLSANSLNKITMGFSDNLITSTVRAWDTTGMIDSPRPSVPLPYGARKVIMVAPAMNTAMWNHPVTKKHLDTLSSEWSVQNDGWFEVLRPIEKELACGDTGSGAMCDWREIVAAIELRFYLTASQDSTSTPNWHKKARWGEKEK